MVTDKLNLLLTHLGLRYELGTLFSKNVIGIKIPHKKEWLWADRTHWTYKYENIK